ncbi:MAG: solute-binding protein [Chloroflexi bacterium]|nr:solute-binding protein [Chloroflexota bacterium]
MQISPLRRRAGVLIILAVLMCLTGCQRLFDPLTDSARPAEPTTAPVNVVRVVTSWAALPLVESLRVAYIDKHPTTLVQIEAIESRLANDLLQRGDADIAFSIDDTTGGSITETIALAPRDQRQRVAADVMVIAVSVNTPITNVSTAQLRDLYAGRIQTWDVLGGEAVRVEFVSREAGSAERGLFDLAVMQGESLSTAAVVLPSDAAVRDYLVSHPGALGYLSAAYVDARIKVVALDGYTPDPRVMTAGYYPLERTISVELGPNAPQAAREFYELAISSQGCRIATERYICRR